jgi:hypothetical protein
VAEPHLDHPGDFHWFKGYGPAPVTGACPHTCWHNAQTVIAWGPDMDRYELVACDAECGGECRAWIDGHGVVTSAWLQVGVPAISASCR